jgi:hypothetical protein
MLDPCADPVLSAVERVTVEPVTGIEPALSDWEALRSARTVTCSLPRSWPTAVRGTGGDRVCPRIQVRSGTRMARATPCLQNRAACRGHVRWAGARLGLRGRGLSRAVGCGVPVDFAEEGTELTDVGAVAKDLLGNVAQTEARLFL